MARHPLAKARRFMSVGRHYRPDPRHPTLGDDFYDVVAAAEFPRADLRFRNQRWAERVGLGDLDDAEWLDHFAAFARLSYNIPEPLALRCAAPRGRPSRSSRAAMRSRSAARGPGRQAALRSRLRPFPGAPEERRGRQRRNRRRK